MRSVHRTLALGLVAGVASLGLFGAAALATFGPEVSTAVSSVIAPTGSSLLTQDKPDKLKGILDALVQRGVISQQQADAILAALRDAATRDKDAAGSRAKAAVLRDFLAVAAGYLGIPEKELRAKLPGTSLGAIANATAGKSKDGLTLTLNAEANADVDRALANNRITEDQAKKLREGLAERIKTFVDRAWPAPKARGNERSTKAVRAPNVKSFLGDMSKTAQTFLGLSARDIADAMRGGKSLGDLANATPNGRQGLIAALTSTANAHIDKALTENKITPDQATSLKSKVGVEIASFVDRKLQLRNTVKPAAPVIPNVPASPLPTPREPRD